MERVYPNDDPDTAAKKIAKDFHFTIPENGNGKAKTSHYVQKRSEGDHLLAESIIIGNDAYFSVAQRTNDKNSIRLEKSIPLTDTCEYKPYEKQANPIHSIRKKTLKPVLTKQGRKHLIVYIKR